MNKQLIEKFRPQTFSEVYGNELAVRSLQSVLSDSTRPHSYLFTGPSGCGKSTLAKIVAKELDSDIIQFDAATNSGVESTRKLVEASGFKPLSGKNIVYIIEEAHNFSGGKGFEPLLLLTESPPPWLYIIFCTTNPQKVPQTIKTRSFHVNLKPLKPFELMDFVSMIAELEGWNLSSDVLTGIVQASEGSPRQALVILQVGHACSTKEELSQIIEAVESEEDPSAKLCQLLMRGSQNWKQISKLLEEIQGNEEDTLIRSCRYIAKAICRSEEAQAIQFSKLLHALTRFSTFDPRINLVAGITWYLFGNVIF